MALVLQVQLEIYDGPGVITKEVVTELLSGGCEFGIMQMNRFSLSICRSCIVVAYLRLSRQLISSSYL